MHFSVRGFGCALFYLRSKFISYIYKKKGRRKMKFCAKCGAQLPDEATTCLNCQTPSTPLPSQKKKINKLYFFLPILLIAASAVTFAATHFLLPQSSDTTDAKSNETSVFVETASNSDVCPADEYGHHSWGSATCEHPAVCLECGAYRDNKLGYHDFDYDEETDMIVCWHCDMPKEEYENKE